MPHVSLIIFGSVTQGISIAVERRSHLACFDYWDGNWLSARVSVKLGGFAGSVDADLRAEEILVFRDQLKKLYTSLEGRAVFQTMEGWLELILVGTKTGHIQLEGDLMDQPGVGNRLSFSLELDQSYLPSVLSALDETCLNFPVLGSP